MSQFHGFSVDGFDLTAQDEAGCLWTVEALDGWYTGGGVRSAIDTRAQQNGDHRGKAYRAGRVVTLRGKVYAPSTAQLELAGRRLSTLLGSGGFGDFIGDSPAGTMSSRVQLDETPLFDTQSSRYATWQLTVGSEDPLLYGLEVFAQTGLSSVSGGAGLTFPLTFPLDFGVAPGATPGVVSVANAGTASYHPRLRIDGPVTNPVITLAETGDRVALAVTVAAGQWLDIDCARRYVLLNGAVSVKHKVSFVGAWLAVPVGGGTLTWTADSATTASTLSVWSYQGAFL